MEKFKPSSEDHAKFQTAQETLLEKPEKSIIHEILLERFFLQDYFTNLKYTILTPNSVANTEDKNTVFTTAGIQTAIQLFRKDQLEPQKPFFIAQPVTRTQFRDSVDDVSSIAFTNISSGEINGSIDSHNNAVTDWMNCFAELGLDLDKIQLRPKQYSRSWGDIHLSGHKIFYEYDGLELGDSAFLINDNPDDTISTISDVGFGLERLRTVSTGYDYYDLANTTRLSELKYSNLYYQQQALYSALSLMATNNISPSNKGAGYRFRQFSKKLAALEGLDTTTDQVAISRWSDYWRHWSQLEDAHQSLDTGKIITQEIQRNINRLILDELLANDIVDGQAIDINLPKDIFLKRLLNTSAREYIKQRFADALG